MKGEAHFAVCEDYRVPVLLHLQLNVFRRVWKHLRLRTGDFHSTRTHEAVHRNFQRSRLFAFCDGVLHCALFPAVGLNRISFTT